MSIQIEPFFSVVIPTFNRAGMLMRALNSLKDQKYKNFEVLVIDDGSTDDSSLVAESFVKFLNLTYFRLEPSGGPAKPRNCGIERSRGLWICFLDSDDWWYSNRLEALIPHIENEDFIYNSLDKFNSAGEKKGKLEAKGIDLEDPYLDLLTGGNRILNSGVAVRTEIVRKTGKISEDPRFVAVEDFDYWIRISKLTKRFRVIPDSLGAYFMGADQISKPSQKFLAANIAVLSQYYYDLEPSARLHQKGLIAYLEGNYRLQIKDTIGAFGKFFTTLLYGRALLKLKSLVRMAHSLFLLIFSPTK